MKSQLATIAALAMAMGTSYATVAINFNGDFDTFVPQNLANAAGTPTNGMIWGIIVDGNNDGLGGGTFTVPSNLTLGSTQILSVASLATDNVLYISQALTSSTAGSTEGNGTTTGGTGGIYDITGIALTNGVSTGDKFYVVWFNGTAASPGVGGTLTDPTFVIPADSAAVDLTAPFAGVDPIRQAGLAYVGTSGTSTGSGITVSVVPEPSAVLLGAVGALGLLRRRRI